MIVQAERVFERIDDVRKMKNGLLTGGAGGGKTTLINELIKEDFSWGYLTATTGIAAVHLGPKVQTYQSLLRCKDVLELRKGFQSESIHRILSRLREDGYKRLIIDEASMMLAEVFSLVYRACKETGIGLILVGDFLQLPPVVKETDASHTPKPWLAFQSKYWLEFTDNGKNIVRLTINHRTVDEGFVKFLNALRIGDGRLAEKLFAASGVQRDRRAGYIDENFEGLTLVGSNTNRDKINFERYMSCPGPEVAYHKKSVGKPMPDWNEIDIPIRVRLKVGCRVMVTQNRYINGFLAYANGTTGKVVSLQEDSADVRCDPDEKIIRVERCLKNNSSWYAELKDNGEVIWIKIPATASVSFMPLCLAWCANVHKAQGLTLAKVQIFIDDWKFWGINKSGGRVGHSLLYVAVSRAKRGKDVLISGSHSLADACHVDADVKEWK